MISKKKKMKIFSKALCLGLIFSVGPCIISAQTFGQRLTEWIGGTPYQVTNPLPMTHTTLLMGGGQVGVLDTYLSEIPHTGHAFQLLFMSDYPAIHGGAWHIYTDANLHLGLPKNKGNGSFMYLLGAHYSIAGAYRACSWHGMTVDLAPMLTLQAQGNLKSANTNNIGNIKAGIGLDGWARIRYVLPIDAMPIAIGYTLQVPLVGLAFQPDYGQSYYDYASGGNNAPIRLHLSSFPNYRCLRQRLLLELPIRNLTISVGAEHGYQNQMISHLNFRQGYWSVLLGISFDSFALSGNRSARSVNVIRSIE